MIFAIKAIKKLYLLGAVGFAAVLITPSHPARAAVAYITVANYLFFPSTTNIQTGDTVVWTWSMGADDHNAPGRPNAPEALRPKMGQNAELAKMLAAKMAHGSAEVIENAESDLEVDVGAGGELRAGGDVGRACICIVVVEDEGTASGKLQRSASAAGED